MHPPSPPETATRTPVGPPTTLDLRPMRFDGERRSALAFELGAQRAHDVDRTLEELEGAIAEASEKRAALAYGLVDQELADVAFERLGCSSLGAVPELVRPLNLKAVGDRLGLPATARRYLARAPLLLPIGRKRQGNVREITVDDPRVTRLWDRFSIDVGVAVERAARWVGPRVFGRPEAGYRVLVVEDGDRYVIQALCIFRLVTEGDRKHGLIAELLHDRSVAGMRGASHLVGLALRELHDGGADAVHTWSLPHSGSFPILARHAFLPRGAQRIRLRIGVRALDASVAHLVEDRRHWYLSGLDSEGF